MYEAMGFFNSRRTHSSFLKRRREMRAGRERKAEVSYVNRDVRLFPSLRKKNTSQPLGLVCREEKIWMRPFPPPPLRRRLDLFVVERVRRSFERIFFSRRSWRSSRGDSGETAKAFEKF